MGTVTPIRTFVYRPGSFEVPAHDREEKKVQKVWVSDSSEEVEFEGREVEVWEGAPRERSIDPDDHLTVTFRLYECPDGYRVHETVWRLSPGHEDSYTLHPALGYWGYGTYTKEEAWEKYGDYFQYLAPGNG